jgi:hypothetical protein
VGRPSATTCLRACFFVTAFQPWSVNIRSYNRYEVFDIALWTGTGATVDLGRGLDGFPKLVLRASYLDTLQRVVFEAGGRDLTGAAAPTTKSLMI